MKDPGNEVAKKCLIVCAMLTISLWFLSILASSSDISFSVFFAQQRAWCRNEDQTRNKKEDGAEKNAAFRTLALLQTERVASIYIRPKSFI